MKRLTLLEQLTTVQENIETVEKQLNMKMPEYYTLFGAAKTNEWNHLIGVRTKALAYWKRRFNRILLKLGYKL